MDTEFAHICKPHKTREYAKHNHAQASTTDLGSTGLWNWQVPLCHVCFEANNCKLSLTTVGFNQGSFPTQDLYSCKDLS